ncbi:aldo/keto reductase [Paucilactobacillus suebicus]|uniref:Oxidoreductase n=1 Tax=Paucilactobacillus suebicus DSM 5007 = KCTC 3549 TaxID=1423807 RepID=A0A0R1VWU0_9LACO|nr:aldo/keto reductase [Paucilactobacillus suebicus]KRM10168.1 oxidoreductase [Paucilactobacillus suebicus DSM 5007 = KCTC 3549]
MSILTETFELPNGLQIPKVGFGTWQISGGKTAYDAVSNAIEVGYRHIDTAQAYNNESSVGKAVRDSGINREEIFVTSKLPAQIKTYDGALSAFDKTLNNLGLDYLDLYLIHAPWPWSQIGTDHDRDNVETWRAMEKILSSGRAKSIGVSNFNVHDLKNILENSTVAPMVDQIQYYVGYTEPKITSFSEENGILLEAYSPLATGDLVNNDQIKAMAAKYGVSVPQLALRFCIENGVLPLPKATGTAHIESNAELNFSISSADMKILNDLPDTAPMHMHNATQG